MYKALVSLIFSILLPYTAFARQAHPAAVPTMLYSKPDEKARVLKKIDEKYQAAQSLTMGVHKVDKVSALDQTRESDGRLLIKKGKFRLELESADKNKDKSLMVADGKTLWIVTPPAKEFKNSKTIVIKSQLTGKKAQALDLLRYLTQGGILNYFKVTGVNEKGDELTYFLQPNKKSLEFQRAQIVANKKEEVIVQLKYWDSVDNETEYQFKKVELDKEIKDDLLKYEPPKDADVTTY